jgi:Methyltransferase domain
MMSEQLEEFATALAAGYDVYTGPLLRSKLLSELEECIQQLNWFLIKCAKLKAGQSGVDRQSTLDSPTKLVISSSDSTVDANHNERSVSSAVTWLIDNLVIVDECLESAGKGLPKCDYGRLPKIKEGRFAGLPRIYHMAVCLTFHLGNRLDTGSLKRFLLAYQQVAPLTITELWSVATTLWLVLTENLQHIITQIVATHEEGDKAPLALRHLPLSYYDFVYIDGSHRAVDVLEDAVLAWRLIKQGGILTFDDYRWEGAFDYTNCPKIAIDAFLEIYSGQFTFIREDYQVTIKKVAEGSRS